MAFNPNKMISGPTVTQPGAVGLALQAAHASFSAGFGKSESAGTGVSVSGQIACYMLPALEMVDTCIAFELQTETPGVELAIDLFVRGYITEDECQVIVRCNGEHWDTVKLSVLARGEKMTAEQVMEYARRFNAPQEWIDARLQELGYVDEVQRRGVQLLYDQLPNVNDHLHWLQRNVFDADYVRDYRLTEGFEDRFWAQYGADLTAQGYTKDRARNEYAAHWIQPAPTQMQEMIYRLRPGQMKKLLDAQVADGVLAPADRDAMLARRDNFTVTDYQRILAEQDYSPLSRGWLAAVAYRVPALGYIRDMFRQGIIDAAQLKSYHQDLGYSDADSDNFVAVDEIQKSRMRRSAARGWTPAALAQAYATGQIPALQVTAGMGQLGYTPAEADDLMERAAYEYTAKITTRARTRVTSSILIQVKDGLLTGTIDRQAAIDMLRVIGYQGPQAIGYADSVIVEGRTRLVKAAVQRLRSGYLRGEMTIAQATDHLRQLNLSTESIAQYVQLWTLSLTPRRRQRSATEIVHSLSVGDISRATAASMLTNLGYNDVDTRLYLADAQRAAAKIRSQQLAARAKAGAARDKQLKQAAQAAAKQAKAVLAALMKETPPSKLQKWAKLGIINEGTFYARLRLYGFQDSVIAAWWDEACAAKGAQCDTSLNVAALGDGGAEGSGPAPK